MAWAHGDPVLGTVVVFGAQLQAEIVHVIAHPGMEMVAVAIFRLFPPFAEQADAQLVHALGIGPAPGAGYKVVQVLNLVHVNAGGVVEVAQIGAAQQQVF